MKRAYPIFSLCLGILLFVYILLRAIFVEPIHDEIATLFHYIDYGTIWGKDTVIDANNHLLNSFLGKVCYSLFGDHIWAIRLPNVLSFPLFFWSVYKLSLFLKKEGLKYAFLVAMTCIPYILDYFAYCRGYALSMAFLMFAIYQFILLNERYQLGRWILVIFSVLLAIYANLNLVLSGILIFGYLGVKYLVECSKTKNYRVLIHYIIGGIFTCVALLPAGIFAYYLKINGALYYGTKLGLWLTTGKTLSENVLFTDSVIIKYVLIALLLLLVFYLVYTAIERGMERLFQQPATLWVGLFLGNLIAIEVMRWLMNTNYPEDRVGMQLIFLLIGAVFFVAQRFVLARWLPIIFLVFPIVGATHFNFISSVFSPEDRLEQTYYEQIKKQMQEGKVTDIYFIQQLVYAYHVRKDNPTNFWVPNVFNSHQQYTEEIVSSRNNLHEVTDKGYDLLWYNPRTHHYFLRKKELHSWRQIKDSILPSQNFSEKYYNLLQLNDSIVKEPTKYEISCRLHTPQLRRETVVLVVDELLQNGKSRYYAFNLNWAAGKNKTYRFHKNIEFDPKVAKKMNIYLYNPNELPYQILQNSLLIFK